MTQDDKMCAGSHVRTKAEKLPEVSVIFKYGSIEKYLYFRRYLKHHYVTPRLATVPKTSMISLSLLTELRLYD